LISAKFDNRATTAAYVKDVFARTIEDIKTYLNFKLKF